MKCINCGSINQKDAQLCKKCGKRMGSFCPDCKAPITPKDKFCKNCGARLSADAKADQSKAAGLKSPSSTLPKGAPGKPSSQQPKRKIPVWAIAILGILGVAILVLAVLLLTGKISVRFGATLPTQTKVPTTITPIMVNTAAPMVTSTLTPTVTPTFTPTVTPTATAIYNPVSVNFACDPNQPQFVLEHQPFDLMTKWLAKTEQQVNDFLKNTKLTVLFDDQDISSSIESYKPFFDEVNKAYRVNFGIAKAGVVPLGAHIVKSTFEFKNSFSDGANKYGPGTKYPTFSNECTIMVGAPDSSWKVVFQTNFSIDGTMGTVKTVGEKANFITSIKDDVYHLDLTNQNNTGGEFFNWSYAKPAGSNVIITMEGKQVEGALTAEYGVTLRGSADYGDSKLFLINPATQKFRYVQKSDQATVAKELFSGQSSAIAQNGFNEITVEANKNIYIFWINRQFIQAIEDPSAVVAGIVGLNAMVQKPGERAVFEFDNLLIRSQQ